MKAHLKKIILFLCFLVFAYTAFGQCVNTPTCTLTAPVSAGDYKARDAVKALPNAAGANQTRLFIDPTIQLDANYSTGGVNYSNTFPSIDYNRPVGAISGSGNVTPSGQANYTIPITLPPGTKGMVPSLSISYNSGSSDGLLGRGWNINGISAITRAPKDDYHDNIRVCIPFNSPVSAYYKKGIQIDNTDGYALDGMRMIFNSGSNTYRLANDNFSKITFSAGTFKMETKDGMTMEYGSDVTNTFSQLIVNDKNNTPQIFAWYLSKVYDKYGNYISYIYDNNTTNREVAIKEIKYTGNAAAGISPYNSIKFYYDKRKDASTRYLLNNALKSTLLLRELEVYCENKFMKRYEFKYGYATTGETFLNELIEQGSDYTKLNSTVIKYGEAIPQINTVSSTELAPDFPVNADYYAGDYNGDGKSDLLVFKCYINADGTRTYSGWDLYHNDDNGTTYSLITNIPPLPANFLPYTVSEYSCDWSPVPSGIQTYDLNADGRDDVLLGSRSGNTITYFPYFSNGNGFTKGTTAQSFQMDKDYDQLVLADIDGDTRPEAIIYSKQGAPYFRIEFLESGVCSYMNSFETISGTVSPQYNGFTPIDFDGDGIQELLTVWAGYKVVLKFLLDPFCKSACAPNCGGAQPHKVKEVWRELLGGVMTIGAYRENYFGDFNGDGITDIVKVDSKWNPAYSGAYLYLGTGIGYSTPQYFPDTDNFELGKKYMVLDINNDGKSDFLELLRYNGEIHIYANYGDQTDPLFGRTYIGYANGTFPDYQNYVLNNIDVQPADGATDDGDNYNNLYPGNNDYIPEFVTGDFDGDGRTDIFLKRASSGSGVKRMIMYVNKGSTRHLATTISDGFRLNTKYKYATMANGGQSVYVKNTAPTLFPLMNVQMPSYIVKEFTVPDGIGGNSMTSYKYEGGTMHLEGKGFLGFDKVTATNSVNNTKIESNYAFINAINVHASLYEKVPSLTKTSLISPATLVSEESYATGFQAIFNDCGGSRAVSHFTKTNQIITRDHIYGKKVTKDFVYDANGNITNATTTIGNTIFSNTVETNVVSTPVYVSAGSWLPNAPDEVTTTVTRTEDASNPYVRKVKYTYDLTKGDVTKTNQDPNASNNKNLITDYEYFPATGVLKKQTMSSPENDLPYTLPAKTVEYIYDLPLQRFATQIKNPLNQSSFATYDPKWGKPLTETDISGLTTIYEYDGYGRNTKVTTPDNLSTTTTFLWATTASPNPVAQTDYTRTTFASSIVANALYSVSTQRPGSPTSKTIYDIYGRELAAETDGFAGKLFSANKYDTRGNIEKASGSYQNGVVMAPVITTNTYDDLNRMTAVHTVSANGSAVTLTTFAYSVPPAADGSSVIETTTADGKVFRKTTDASGLLKLAHDEGGDIAYSYYSNRQLKQTTVNGLVTNTIEYDQLGRQTKLTEANSGISEYKYNVYGELFYQKDARGNETRFEYNDVLGRMTLKKCTTAVTGVVDTYTFNYVLSGNGLNNIQSMSGPGNISYSYTYDNLHRVTNVNENINGPLFSTSYEYDGFGNIEKQTYPSGFAIKHSYTANGYHTQIMRADNNALIYQANEMNALGQYNKYTLGNGIQTQKTFTDRGMPSNFTAGGIQNTEYSFSHINGNLIYRTDFIANHTETFEYDNLDRLTNIYLDGSLAHNTAYAASGNISSKSDAGAGAYLYAAPGPKPHAVSRINNPTIYISESPQTIAYTPFQKAKTITEGLYTLDLIYGPDDERKKTELRLNNFLTTRYFTGDYEKTIVGSSTTEVHYINSGSGLVGMYVITNGVGTMYYPYTDHLGSILKVTNTAGTVVAQQSFDAWGNYRDTHSWQPAYPIGSGVAWLYRGYTGHEHLNEFALINMNGRMYDPVVGRMLSPDVMLQAPDYTQSHNRYSYVLNNPLKYIDPSGMEGRGIDWMNDAFVEEEKYNRAFTNAMHAEEFKKRGDTWGRYETVSSKGGIYKDKLYMPVIERPSSTTIFTPLANAANIETAYRMVNKRMGVLDQTSMGANGANNRNSQSNGRFISPIENGIISDVWGSPRPSGPHSGVDITTIDGSYGKDIRSSTSGKVVNVVKNLDGKAGGIRVSVLDENGYTHSYNHMIPGSNQYLKFGQDISQGFVMGRVGGTAYDKIEGVKAHLHYMIFAPGGGKINPVLYNDALKLLPLK